MLILSGGASEAEISDNTGTKTKPEGSPKYRFGTPPANAPDTETWDDGAEDSMNKIPDQKVVDQLYDIYRTVLAAEASFRKDGESHIADSVRKRMEYATSDS